MTIYLAPMEGVIDHHMRLLLTNIGGVETCVTEFIRVTDHVLPEKVFHKYCPELSEKNYPVPVRIQLLGSNPQALAKNAEKAARMGAPGIDLNFGCPAKTVNKNKGGACLLDNTELIKEIVTRVREAVPTDTPVTAKIRLGNNERDSFLRNAMAIEAAGADELVVHARSKSDGYNPPAYWSMIADIRKAVSIKVVANGEIWNISDFQHCKEQSQCQHFMLGRGILARPDLALAIKAHLSNKQYTYLSWTQIASYLQSFFINTCTYYPKKYTGNRLKQWLHYLQINYPEAKQLFAQIKRIRDEKSISEAIKNSINQ